MQNQKKTSHHQYIILIKAFLFSEILAWEHSPPYQGPLSPLRLLLLPLLLHILNPHGASIKVDFFSPDRTILSQPRNNHFFRLANPYLQLDNAAAISKVAKSNPYLEKFSSNTSSQATQPMPRPVYLCEQHRKQRIMIEVQIVIIVVRMQIIL